MLLQVAALRVRYTHPLRLVYDLAASDSINGYYTVATRIQDIGAFLRDYPALMPTLPNHVTTHPPGIVLLFWSTGRVVINPDEISKAIAVARAFCLQQAPEWPEERSSSTATTAPD